MVRFKNFLDGDLISFQIQVSPDIKNEPEENAIDGRFGNVLVAMQTRDGDVINFNIDLNQFTGDARNVVASRMAAMADWLEDKVVAFLSSKLSKVQE